ncbi:CapA family protein [Aquibacillus koreensis]|uniref:CapA family protein n=1 Tax=Aquibacillus koreensis TaxID=279446 RepID=A0A9X3WLA5_9BACI|nr:CapA family protein [Aquibacillus koreensis]MCT2534934.1 CapA family protein [Aquibacillus koreensis]MDC3422172.1 CapA family protein [Aquibacillus koreensis]
MKSKGLKLLLIIVAILIINACGIIQDEAEDPVENENEPQTDEVVEENEVEEPEPTEETAPPEPEPDPEPVVKEISVAAIGDMLIHNSVYEDAQIANGSYDFVPMLEQVEPYLSNSTITIANQETMIGGVELGLSSYPTFNSPVEVGNALRDVGVDVVTLANNHTLDRGEEVIQRAIEHWETIDMMYTGSYKDEQDRQQIRVMETDEGIDVSFLGYTYGTNGIPVPEGKDYLVNLIDKDIMKADIERAKEMSDVIILNLHFGNEYERMPNEQQKDLVQFAADLGVDVVIGHHPHVLQPVDWVEGKDGNKTFVAYSLGNFLSAQDEFYRRIGGVVGFTIEQTIDGDQEEIVIKEPTFLPTFVQFNLNTWSGYKVIPMYELTESQLSNASGHYEEIKTHMSQWVPDLEFIENK